MSQPSLVFFGNEKLATGIEPPQPVILNALKAAGYDIEAVVTVAPAEHYQSQLAVLAAYGRILRPATLELFPLGIINVHPSLLPIYRGPTPIEQVILDGAQQTGVSIMKLTAEMDAGPLLAQASIDLNGSEAKAELAKTSQHLGAELMVKAVADIFASTAMFKEQDDSKASYCKKIVKADGQIDWTKPAAQIEREIRAYSGWPGSYTQLFDKDVIITKAHVVPVNHPPEKPGDVEVIKDIGAIMVECGQGTLCIERLKPAGKREMSGQEFLAGRKL